MYNSYLRKAEDLVVAAFLLRMRREGTESGCDYLESHGWLEAELLLETSFALIRWLSGDNETASVVLGGGST